MPTNPSSSFRFNPTLVDGYDACFIVYNLKNDEVEYEYGGARCKQKTAPCSTFKLPLAVMAFNEGVLKDENTMFRWDKKQRLLPGWNKDQTSATWMKESVVWFSQILTAKMGREKVEWYLKKFDYGNQDFSGDLDAAWLTPSPLDKNEPNSTLKISPYEQIDFMKRLWTMSLPVKQRSVELTKKIIFLEDSPNGYHLSGKTGSGYLESDKSLRLGWFVSHLEAHGKEYVMVLALTEKDQSTKNASYAGPVAKEITKKILLENKMW